MRPAFATAIVGLVLGLAAPGAAQPQPKAGGPPRPEAMQPPPPTAQLEAMKKLDFLVGSWEGGGWMEFVPGQRLEFQGRESVQKKLGGIGLLVEGFHTTVPAPDRPAVPVHEALAFITYDEAAGDYRFDSHLATGRHSEARLQMQDGAAVWSMTTPMGSMRYTIRLDDQGRWFEIGEMSRDGQSWRKFFEMTLGKVE